MYFTIFFSKTASSLLSSNHARLFIPSAAVLTEETLANMQNV